MERRKSAGPRCSVARRASRPRRHQEKKFQAGDVNRNENGKNATTRWASARRNELREKAIWQPVEKSFALRAIGTAPAPRCPKLDIFRRTCRQRGSLSRAVLPSSGRRSSSSTLQQAARCHRRPLLQQAARCRRRPRHVPRRPFSRLPARTAGRTFRRRDGSTRRRRSHTTIGHARPGRRLATAWTAQSARTGAIRPACLRRCLQNPIPASIASEPTVSSSVCIDQSSLDSPASALLDMNRLLTISGLEAILQTPPSGENCREDTGQHDAVERAGPPDRQTAHRHARDVFQVQ